MGNLRHPKAVEPLIRALKDKYWHTRCEAAASLGKMGDSRAVKPLLKALKDSSEHVQYVALEALGKLKDHRAVKPMIAFTNNTDKRNQHMAILALGKIGHVNLPVLKVILKALKEEWASRTAKGDIRCVPLIYRL